MENLKLEIVTPDKTVLSQKVAYVGVPGLEGQFGVLANHISMLSAISPGVLYYRLDDGQQKYAFVSSGFVDVNNNTITVLTESSELGSDIDVVRANNALNRAKERIEKHDDKTDMNRAEFALKRAINRLNASKSIS